MKWESADFAVGAVVVTGMLILVGSFIWLSPVASKRTYPLYTEFDRIDGINTQANVVLRGYTVGSVGAIEPRVSDDGSLRFRVQLEIMSRLASGDSLRLPGGTVARLMPPPVIGAGFIQLETPATGGGRTLDPGSQIPGVRNTAIVEQVQGMTGEISGEVVQTMLTARELMDSMTSAIVMANGALLRTTDAIPPLVRGLEQQLVLAQQLTEDLRTQLNTIGPATVASIDTATLLLAESRTLVAELNGFLGSTTPEVGSILANLDTTSVLLTHLVRQLSERPWRALTGVKPPEGLDPPEPGAAISSGSPGDTIPARFRTRSDSAAGDTVPPPPETAPTLRP